MSIFLGTSGLQKAYLGSSEIEKIYQGTTEIYTSSYNLGSESAVDSADGFGESGSVSSTASFTFNTNGTVTAVSGDTPPYTNWNIVGGSHISYRIVSTVSNGGSWSAPMAASSDGSVRVAITSARAFTASGSAGASAAAGAGGYYEESIDRTIEIWVWNAASGGKVIAKGTYRIAASAGFNYTGDPL